MSAVPPRNLWRPLAVVSALVFVYASVLVKLSHDWWVDENYSHGLLIPFRNRLHTLGRTKEAGAGPQSALHAPGRSRNSIGVVCLMDRRGRR